MADAVEAFLSSRSDPALIEYARVRDEDDGEAPGIDPEDDPALSAIVGVLGAEQVAKLIEADPIDPTAGA